MKCLLRHKWSPWADLGDYLNRQFRKCERCDKTQISKGSMR